MELGVIEVYFKDKKFGFILTDSGERIYFTYWNGRLVEEGHNQPIFSSKPMSRTSDRALYASFPLPKRGDVVLFQRKQDSPNRKAKASLWAYYADWNTVERTIAKRLRFRTLNRT